MKYTLIYLVSSSTVNNFFFVFLSCMNSIAEYLCQQIDNNNSFPDIYEPNAKYIEPPQAR